MAHPFHLVQLGNDWTPSRSPPVLSFLWNKSEVHLKKRFGPEGPIQRTLGNLWFPVRARDGRSRDFLLRRRAAGAVALHAAVDPVDSGVHSVPATPVNTGKSSCFWNGLVCLCPKVITCFLINCDSKLCHNFCAPPCWVKSNSCAPSFDAANEPKTSCVHKFEYLSDNFLLVHEDNSISAQREPIHVMWPFWDQNKTVCKPSSISEGRATDTTPTRSALIRPWRCSLGAPGDEPSLWTLFLCQRRSYIPVTKKQSMLRSVFGSRLNPDAGIGWKGYVSSTSFAWWNLLFDVNGQFESRTTGRQLWITLTVKSCLLASNNSGTPSKASLWSIFSDKYQNGSNV